MAGETVGMANIVRGIVQHGRIGKAGSENQEAADEKGDDTGRKAVDEGERDARNCSRSHDNLRDGAWENSHQLGTMPFINRQVSWLAASGASHQEVCLAFPGSGPWSAAAVASTGSPA
jgi:hypothetical protein